ESADRLPVREHARRAGDRDRVRAAAGRLRRPGVDPHLRAAARRDQRLHQADPEDPDPAAQLPHLRVVRAGAERGPLRPRRLARPGHPVDDGRGVARRRGGQPAQRDHLLGARRAV
ncbi:MAG: hypothetical protein AVDCRST_MAG49-1865, partial [uncultured Thermomicrobiales bacterium]